MHFEGVMPAITTAFREDGSIDHEFVERHVRWLIESGCTAIIPGGSLGEGATLDAGEKVELFETCVRACGDSAPVAPGIAATSTQGAVWLCQQAQAVGCRGLMILPPYVHKGPMAEMLAHFSAMLEATDLPCMLYNNPIAYGVDVSPESIVGLADRHDNLVAVKESSGDVRRITALRTLAGDRLSLSVGLDDLAVEGALAGANGWVAGLVNALPRESVSLFASALHQRERAGGSPVPGGAGKAEPLSAAELQSLYSWFLPLLRLDTVPEFVQWIKLVQQEVGMGNERVRAPRGLLTAEVREKGLGTIRSQLAERPQ